jgi:hypothetical protein
MPTLEVILLGAPFLGGIGSLIWGLGRIHRRQAAREQFIQDRRCGCVMLLACLLVAVFFPVTLLVLSLPVALEVLTVVTLSLSLIAIGEYSMRSAAIFLGRRVPGAQWLVFLGLMMLFFYLPVALGWHVKNLPGFLTGPLVVVWPALLVFLIWVQERLIRRWGRIGRRWRRWRVRVAMRARGG